MLMMIGLYNGPFAHIGGGLTFHFAATTTCIIVGGNTTFSGSNSPLYKPIIPNIVNQGFHLFRFHSKATKRYYCVVMVVPFLYIYSHSTLGIGTTSMAGHYLPKSISALHSVAATTCNRIEARPIWLAN